MYIKILTFKLIYTQLFHGKELRLRKYWLRKKRAKNKVLIAVS